MIHRWKMVMSAKMPMISRISEMIFASGLG